MSSTIASLAYGKGAFSRVWLSPCWWSVVVSDVPVGDGVDGQFLWHDRDVNVELYASALKDGCFIFVFPQIAHIDVSLTDRVIMVAVGSGVTDDTVRHLLADQVFPRIVAHSVGLVLHAGAVRIANRAVLFLAPSGSGKSTMVASFRLAGHSLIGDDAVKVVLSDDGPLAEAVYPSLRLLPDSIAALYAQPPEVTQVAHYSEKQRVLMPLDEAHCGDALSVAAVFFLGPESETGQITRESVSSGDACIQLMENSFALDPSDVKVTHRRLQEAARLVTSVPCYRLGYPRDYARLPDVHQCIIDAIAEQSV